MARNTKTPGGVGAGGAVGSDGSRRDALEHALSSANGAARVLRDAALQAASIEEAATRLGAGGNEQAAAGEQIRASLEGLAAGVEETGISVHGMASSQAHVAATARELQQAQETVSAGLR